MATWSTASAQYENRFDEKCACGASLWRTIEWAHQQNISRRAMPIMLEAGESENGYIIIKRCKPCREKATKVYNDAANS
jgi:hypothetical protein